MKDILAFIIIILLTTVFIIILIFLVQYYIFFKYKNPLWKKFKDKSIYNMLLSCNFQFSSDETILISSVGTNISKRRMFLFVYINYYRILSIEHCIWIPPFSSSARYLNKVFKSIKSPDNNLDIIRRIFGDQIKGG